MKYEDAGLRAAIDDWLVDHEVTRCPPAAVLPTTATLAGNAGLTSQREKATAELIAKTAKTYRKGRLKWLQGMSHKSSKRRAVLAVV